MKFEGEILLISLLSLLLEHSHILYIDIRQTDRRSCFRDESFYLPVLLLIVFFTYFHVIHENMKANIVSFSYLSSFELNLFSRNG